MLRQQQAEIEVLKAAKIRAYNNGVEDGRKPDTNNKPVAWMNPNESSIDYKFSDECAGDWNIPLYTHPVKELDEQFKKGFEAGKEEGWKAHKFHYPVKELTDEEILGVWQEKSSSGELYYDLLEFARAILRKAQE